MADRDDRPGAATAVVSASHVRLINEAVRVGPAAEVAATTTTTAGRPGGHGPARVEVIREHDVVRAVEVICPCGERIVVRCDYE